MIKKAKDTIKLTLVILLAILTFNIVYDIDTSSSVKMQEESTPTPMADLDKVKAIAAEESSSSESTPTIITESSQSKAIKYGTIIGIIVISCAMLVVLSKKEDDN